MSGKGLRLRKARRPKSDAAGWATLVSVIFILATVAWLQGEVACPAPLVEYRPDR